MLFLPPCHNCSRFRGQDRCDAFPDGIPWAILFWKHDHRTSYPGDNGIRFSPIPPDRRGVGGAPRLENT